MLRLQTLGFRLLLLLLLLLLISTTLIAQDGSKPIPSISLDQNEQAQLRELQLSNTTIQLRMENLRLSVCLRNGVGQKECGGWTQQGTIIRNIIPIVKEKEKEGEPKK